MLRQITSGLEYLHAKNVCHRDLKPKNIFISFPDATVIPQMKLGGLGLTRFDKTALPLCKQVGTNAAWMAPEICDRKFFITPMDIFSLGLVFAFVLSGGLHVFGNNKEERIFNIKEKNPVNLTLQQLGDIDGIAEIFDLILSMISFDPDERPSASSVINDTFFSQTALQLRGDEAAILASAFLATQNGNL